jgi:hypothetical protein
MSFRASAVQAEASSRKKSAPIQDFLDPGTSVIFTSGPALSVLRTADRFPHFSGEPLSS